MKSLIRGWQALLAAMALSAAVPAIALDAVAARLPAPVDDGRLAIGARSVVLPPGNWTLVARNEGVVRRGAGTAATFATVYAMQAEGDAMRAGVVARLPTRMSPIDDWDEDPCRHAEGQFMDRLYRDDFGETGRHCLLVFRHRTHLAGRNLDPLFAEARNWTQSANVKLAGPFYELWYARYARNGFGWVRLFVPTSTFASDAEATAWARQLPAALRELFEQRAGEAVLPALPKKNS